MEKGLKTVLMKLIVSYGKVKAVGVKKPVSNRTQDWRESCLFLMFSELKALGYKLESPYGFREKHLRHLVSNWEKNGLSAATIQNRISVARTFASWIGKPGMIRTSEHYVERKSSVTRSSTAATDKSWSAQGVNVWSVITMVDEIDRYVGMQMHLMRVFGLRREEAVMFKPHRADYGIYIKVRDGTKGGRERNISITNDEQRKVLDAAKEQVKKVDGHVGHPDRTLKQALRRFNYVLERVGATRRGLGITSHGLRHQRLNDLYEEVAGTPSPVRRQQREDSDSLPQPDPMLHDLARARVSEEGGHTRLSISNAYIGSNKPSKNPVLNWNPQGGDTQGGRRLYELQTKADRNGEEDKEFSMLKATLLRKTSEVEEPA